MVTSPFFFGCPSSTGTGLWAVGAARFVIMLRVHQGHGDVCHAERLAVAGSGENHVLHAGAAQGLGRLFAQHPTDGIADVRLAAAVRPHDGGDALAVEAQLGALAEGLESLEFDAFEFQQSTIPPASGEL